MPISVDNYFQAVRDMDGNTLIHADAGTGNVSRGRGIGFFRSLFSSNVRAANQSNVLAFKAAIASDPKYAGALRGSLQRKINDMLASASPLTASAIREIGQDLRNFDHLRANAFANECLDMGRLPDQGAVHEFTRFLVDGGRDIGSNEQKLDALRDFISQRFLSDASLFSLPGVSPQENKFLMQLEELRGGSYSELAGQYLAGRTSLDDFSFDALRSVLTEHCRANGDLAVIEKLPAGSRMELLAVMDGAPAYCPSMDVNDYMQTLQAAAVHFEGGELQSFIDDLRMTNPAVSTPEQRRNAVTAFLVRMERSAAADIADKALKENGLPEGTGKALAFNQEVMRAAIASLSNAGDLSSDDVRNALVSAAKDFAKAHSAEIARIAELAANGGGEGIEGIKPPFNTGNLPLYLNAMLSADAMIKPLVDGSTDMGSPETLRAMDTFSQNVRSAASLTKKEFGGDDFDDLTRSSLLLMMRMKGIGHDAAPEMYRRASALFGGLTGQLDMAEKAHPFNYGLKNCLSSLSITLRTVHSALLTALDDGQKQTLTRDGVPTDADGSAFERQKNAVTSLSRISAGVRELAAGFGALVAEPYVPKASSFGTLSAGAVNAVVRKFGGEAALDPNVIVRPTEAFRTLFAAINTDGRFNGIDPSMINLACMKFTDTAIKPLDTLRNAAAGAGRMPTESDLESAFTENLKKLLKEYKTALDRIDALPSSKAEPITGADRAMMKNLVHLYGITDAEALKGAVMLAKSLASEMKTFTSPLAPPDKILESVGMMSNKIAAFMGRHGFDSSKAEFIEYRTAVCHSAISLLGISGAGLAAMLANLRSESCKTVEKGLAYASGVMDEADKDATVPLLARQMLNDLAAAADIAENGFHKKSAGLEDEPFSNLSECGAASVGIARMMHGDDKIARFAYGKLATLHPPLNDADMASVVNMIRDAVRETEESGNEPPVYNSDVVIHYMCAAARELASAQNAKGSPLSHEEIFRIVTGDGETGGNDAGFAAKLFNHMAGRYAAVRRNAFNEVMNDIELRQEFINVPDAMNIPFAKVLTLLAPEGKLTLGDLQSGNTQMGSLAEIRPDNAYGLATDFYRKHNDVRLFVMRPDGSGSAFTPGEVRDPKESAGNPYYQTIISRVADITQTENQKARVLQACSQASTQLIRFISPMFPNGSVSEHGAFDFTVKPNEDRSVTVEIASPADMPMHLRQQYVIRPDGSCDLTVFELGRQA